MKNAASTFLSPQSILTFPGASLAVAIIWKVMGTVFPAWGGSYPTLFIISLFMGILLFFLGISATMTIREKIISFIISLLNSFMLTASTLGMSSITLLI
ncbi:MAG: hypothetical protein ACM3N9_07955 [Syntrophothermus sp.]